MKKVVAGSMLAAVGVVYGQSKIDEYTTLVDQVGIPIVQVEPSYARQQRMVTVGECGDARYDTIADFLNVEYQPICGDHSHPWARDHFVDLGHRIMVPDSTMTKSFPENIERAKSIRAVMDTVDTRVSGAPFFFEGGQVLATDEYTLVPEMYSEQWLFPYATTVFENALLIPNTVDGAMAFSGHLDMYVTPVNPDTVLVADIVRLDNQDLARVSESYGNVVNSDDARFRDVVNRAADMLSEHYTVERVPMAIVNNGDNIFLGYNNAIVNGDKMVVSKYGISLDDKVLEQYQRYGDVLQVESRDWAEQSSGPHCKINLY